MPAITPFLWFDDKAEEAVNFYVSIFEHAIISNVSRQAPEEPANEGAVFSMTFELEGQKFMALNGGPHYEFSPAISLFISCETQADVDRYWDRLSEGGQTMQCGWVTDKYGITWQVIPDLLGELLGDDDENKAGNVMQAMLAMTKLDMAALQRAYDEA